MSRRYGNVNLLHHTIAETTDISMATSEFANTLIDAVGI